LYEIRATPVEEYSAMVDSFLRTVAAAVLKYTGLVPTGLGEQQRLPKTTFS
jgi:hypothetical protein